MHAKIMGTFNKCRTLRSQHLTRFLRHHSVSYIPEQHTTKKPVQQNETVQIALGILQVQLLDSLKGIERNHCSLLRDNLLVFYGLIKPFQLCAQ